jgi:hypothetical protein
MARLRRFSLLLLAASQFACAGAGMTTYTPVREKTKVSADTLHRASRDAIEALGYQPVAVDAQTHSLDTREKEVAVSSIPRLSYKYAFHIETTGGILAIDAKCTQNSASNEATFEDCGEDRPERVVNAMAQIKKRILATAPTIDAQNPDWKSLESPPPDEDEKPAAKEDEKTGDDKKAPGGKKADEKAAADEAAGEKTEASKPSDKTKSVAKAAEGKK